MTRLQQYWDHFYSGRDGAQVPHDPSAFAEWVADHVPRRAPIIEFGFGNARDSFWFARRGHAVDGYDFATSAVDLARRSARHAGVAARFHQLDLYDWMACQETGAKIAVEAESPVVYGRFLVHALQTQGRHNFFDLAALALSKGGHLAIEYRTINDRGEQHAFGEQHFRAYLEPSLVTGELMERGATIEHCEEGYGLAIYKDEDPHIARVIAGIAAGREPGRSEGSAGGTR